MAMRMKLLQAPGELHRLYLGGADVAA